MASLVAAEDPTDIYHAVVSSSFDADRLDYLRGDRLTIGTGAGAIDFDWLMEHVRVADIVSDAPENPGQIQSANRQILRHVQGKWPVAATEWSLAAAGHLSIADGHRGSG